MIDRIFIFAKAQASSFIGGLVDYAMMILCTELLNVHYTISIAIGGIIGAIINFTINKKWTFSNKKSTYKFSFWKQFSRFVVVVLNSILLKSSGTFLFTTFLGIDYKIGRIITDLFVSICINYTLQRHWVFVKTKSQRSSFASNNYNSNNIIES